MADSREDIRDIVYKDTEDLFVAAVNESWRFVDHSDGESVESFVAQYRLVEPLLPMDEDALTPEHIAAGMHPSLLVAFNAISILAAARQANIERYTTYPGLRRNLIGSFVGSTLRHVADTILFGQDAIARVEPRYHRPLSKT